MADGSYTQTVPQKVLDEKIGRTLQKGDEFTTALGRWRVIALCKDGHDTYTVERIG